MIPAAFLVTALLAVSPQGSSTPHCLVPGTLPDASVNCDTVSGLLPIVLELDSGSARVPFARTDVEAIYLGVLGRVLGIGARADSTWAFARRDTTHVWARMTAPSERELRAVMLYWRWQPDATINRVCRSEVTLPVAPRASVAALAAMLGAEVERLGRCVQRAEAIGDDTAGPPGGEAPTFFPLMLLPLSLSVVAFALVWRIFLRRRRPDFWRLAARYPNKAYEWFLRHDEWLVVDPEAGKMPQPDERVFDGPHLLWVPQLGGRRVAVYGRRDEMQESQERFLRVHGLDSEGIDRS